jgi:UDP-glucose 4-epimerase
MIIFLTGGLGYIGSHTVLSLVEAGHEPIVYDNLSNSKIDVVDRLSRIIGYPLRFIEGDIRNKVLLRDSLTEVSADAVIHMAGLKSVSDSCLNPLNYYSTNLHGTLALVEVMNEISLKSLVFSSSATVYGEPLYLPLDENHPTNPMNPYGRNKLQSEQLLSDLAASDPEWSIVSLRYFNPIGAHESGTIGENPRGIPNNLMPYIAQVAAGFLPYLKVFGADYSSFDGTGVRDYIHVMDIAEGHISALNYANCSSGFNVFNLGVGSGFSVLQLIEHFSRATSVKIPYMMAPRRLGDIDTCYADVSRAERILKWRAKYSIEDMCNSAWLWQQYHSSLPFAES